MAPLVVSQTTTSTPAIGGLFANLSFFLLQRLPSRSAYVDKLQANGGRVVRIEAQADYIIADPFRPAACPPGSLSYTYIDAALSSSTLPEPADHLAGPAPGALRDVGNAAVPGKQTRTAFTAEDDRVLWEWVEKYRKDGGMVKGNDIYKQLEAKNKRHTYQAWRDRYIKKLMVRPPEGCGVTAKVNAPPSPPSGPDREEQEEPTGGFTNEDFLTLLENANDIRRISPDQLDDAWEAWAAGQQGTEAEPGTDRTAREWRLYWEQSVWPVYKESDRFGEDVRKEKEEQAAERERLREERRKRRREEAEAMDEPGAKRRSKAAVKDGPSLTQPAGRASRQASVDTSRISLTQPQKVKRERESTSSPRKSAQYGRKSSRPDFSQLFDVDEDELNKPLVPPKPQRPKRAVNPDDPIEILSSDAEKERKKAAKKAGRGSAKGVNGSSRVETTETKAKLVRSSKAEASPGKGLTSRRVPMPRATKARSTTPKWRSTENSVEREPRERHRVPSVQPEDTPILDGNDDGFDAQGQDDLEMQADDVLPTRERDEPTNTDSRIGLPTQRAYTTQVIEMLSSSAETAARRASTEEVGGTPMFTNDDEDNDSVAMEDGDTPFFTNGDYDDSLPKLPAASAEHTTQDPIDDFSLLTSPAYVVNSRAPTRGSAKGVAEDAIPTSEANRAAAWQVLRESQDTGAKSQASRADAEEAVHSTLPTSEANRAAELQVWRESGQRPVEGSSDLPTSDANHAAEQQMMRESGTEIVVRGEDGEQREVPTMSNHSVEDDESQEGVLGQGVLNGDGETPSSDEEDGDYEPGPLTQLETILADDTVANEAEVRSSVDRDVAIGNEEQQDAQAQDAKSESEEEDESDSEAELDEEPTDITISQRLIEDGEMEDGVPGHELLNQSFIPLAPPLARTQPMSESVGLFMSDPVVEHGNVDDDDEDDSMSDSIQSQDAGAHALTAENLASQQAEHAPPRLRAVDLPEDDEAKDQTDFLAYMQGLMGVKAGGPAREAEAVATPAVVRDEARRSQQGGQSPVRGTPPLGREVPSPARARTPSAPATPLREDVVDQTTYTHNTTSVVPATTPRASMNDLLNLPISSEQEIEDVWEASMQWPYSPEKSKRPRESQSEGLLFETQVSYPKLRFEQDDGDSDEEAVPALPQQRSFETQIPCPRLRSEEPEDEVVTQPSRPVAVYPTLPADEAASDNEDEEVQSQTDAEQRQKEDGGDYVMIDRSELADAEEDHEDNEEEYDGYEVDLDVPEPDGGFGLSSSPAKPSDTQSRSQVKEVVMSDDEDDGESNGTRMDTGMVNEESEIDDDDSQPGYASMRPPTADRPPSQRSVSASGLQTQAEIERAEWEAAEDDIDLNVPEPDTGFYSSPFHPSPIQAYQQPPRQTSPFVGSLPQGDEDAESDSAAEDAGEQEVIDISSREASSSPYQSSEAGDDEPAPRGHVQPQLQQVARAMSLPPDSDDDASQISQQAPRNLETQDILNAETQQPDLSMQIPPDSDDEDDEAPRSSYEFQGRQPDLTLPLPEDSDDDVGFPPAPPLRTRAPPVTHAKQPIAAPVQPAQPLRPFKKPLPKPHRAPPPQQINLSETQTLDTNDEVEELITTMMVRRKVTEAAVVAALMATSMRAELADLVLLEQKAGRGVPKDVPGVWSAEEDAIAEGGDARKMKEIVAKHGWDEVTERMEYLDSYRKS